MLRALAEGERERSFSLRVREQKKKRKHNYQFIECSEKKRAEHSLTRKREERKRHPPQALLHKKGDPFPVH